MITLVQLWIASLLFVLTNYGVQKARKGASPERRAEITLDTSIAIIVFCLMLTVSSVIATS